MASWWEIKFLEESAQEFGAYTVFSRIRQGSNCGEMIRSVCLSVCVYHSRDCLSVSLFSAEKNLVIFCSFSFSFYFESLMSIYNV